MQPLMFFLTTSIRSDALTNSLLGHCELSKFKFKPIGRLKVVDGFGLEVSQNPKGPSTIVAGT